MAKELQLRRGNAAEHSTFTGAQGEVTVDLDNKSLHVHDGITAGGFEAARADLLNVSNSAFASKATAAGISGGSSNGTTTGANANASFLIIGTDIWGLPGSRHIQVANGVLGFDGGSGGGYQLEVKLANSTSGPPANLGAASYGSSTYVARADHIHAMPTATDVSAVPNTRVIVPGAGIAVTGGGLLTANTTVSLNAQLSDLTNVQIANATNNDILIYNGATSKWNNYSSNSLGRLTVQDEGLLVGTSNGTTMLNFTGNGVTATVDGTNPNKINVNVPTIYNQQNIQDIVGGMISGDTQLGIAVTYTSGKLNFDVNDFTVTISGDVQGTATVTNLGNVNISTLISPNAVVLGTDTTGNYVGTIAAGATPNGIVVTGAAGEGTAAQVYLNTADSNFVESVQDIVGGLTSNGIQNGIAVVYDDPNNRLNFDVNDFNIILSGGVTGSGKVTNLSDVTITTLIGANAVALGTNTTGNYIATVGAGSNGITVTGSGVAGGAAVIDLNVTNANFIEGVQDAAGALLTNSIQNGITVTYDDPNNRLNFQTNNFTVSLTGPITGSATITNLASASIATTIAANAVALSTQTTGNYIATLAAGANGITVTGSGAHNAAATIDINMMNGTFVEGVQDIVGMLVSNGTQNGVTVVYDDPNNRLNFQTNPFTVTLTGPITGTATITNLGNATLATTVAADAIALGPQTTGNYVATVAAASSNGIVVTGSGSETAAVTLDLNLANPTFIEGVQDAAGLLLTNSIQNGITVTYDDPNNRLNFQTNNFTVTLSGPITGSATITNLSNATIATTIGADAVALGPQTTGNYVATVAAGSNGITVSGSGSETAAVTVDLNLANPTFIEGVQDAAGMLFTNNSIQNGITVTYDDPNNRVNFQTNPFTISLTGAVVGTATVTNLSNATISTTMTADAIVLGTGTTGNYVATLAAVSNALTVTGSGTETAAVTIDLNVTSPIFVEGAQDAAGALLTNSIQNGITVTYDDPNNRLNFQTNPFTISLTGPITGSATITNLTSANLATTIAAGAVALGSQTSGNYLASLTAGANGITVSGAGVAGATPTIDLNMMNGTFVEGVQDIVGMLVSNGIQNGISVIYDDPNNRLNFQTNPFTLTLAGPITGTATVTNLGNATLTTTLGAGVVTLGTHTTGNYVAGVTAGANGITVTGSGTAGANPTIDINMTNGTFVEGVQDIVGMLVSNGIQNGITVLYDDPNNKLNFQANAFTVSLTGPITGSATITNLASASIATTIAANAVALSTQTTGNYVATIATGANGITVSGSGAHNAATTIDLNLASPAFIEGAQDATGLLLTNSIQNGITVTYDDPNNRLNFQTNNFTVTLSGAVNGSATITNLSSATLTTTISANAVALGSQTTGNYVAGLSGGANGIVITGSGVAGATPTIDINMLNGTFVEGVQDIVGMLVSNGIQNGISVIYDDPNNRLNFQTNPFTVTLSGPITGSATITNLGNATIATTIGAGAVALGAQTTGNYVGSVTAGSNGIVVSGSGTANAATTIDINMMNGAFVEGVQDIVGMLVSNGIQNGISVIYDDPNNRLNFQASPFTVTLTGPITGTATVTNLGNATIATTIGADSVALGPQTTGNYVATIATGSNGITVTGSGVETAAVTLDLNLAHPNFIEGVQDAVGSLLTNSIQNGISVVYDDPNNRLNFQTNPFTLTLTGGVTGTATVTNLASTTISTVIGSGAVTLGQQTTGNYVATIGQAATSNGIVVTGAIGSGQNAQIGFNLADPNFVEAVEDTVATLFTAGTSSNFGIQTIYNDAANSMSFVVSNGVIDAATLGTYTAAAFAQKAEAATITNTWTFSNNLVWNNPTGTTVTYSNSITWSLGGVGPALQIDGNRNVTVSAGNLSVGTNAVIHAGNVSTDPNVKEAVEDIAAGLFTNGTHQFLTFTYDDANSRINAAVITTGLSADLLDNYDSTAFTRKAENAVVTGAWTFTTPAGPNSNPYLKITDGTNNLSFFPNLSAGVMNGVVGSGDAAVVGSSALSLTVNQPGTSGIRITSNAVDIETSAFTFGGTSVLTALTGYQLATTFLSSPSYTPDTITTSGASSGTASVAGGSTQGWHILSSLRPGNNNYGVQLGISDTDRTLLKFRSKVNGTWQAWSTIWHSANGGSGSGLDADTVDGLNSTSFIRSDASSTFNSTAANATAIALTMANGVTVSSATDNGAPLYINANNTSSGDAFMTFQAASSYAFHFGLDRSTSDLFVGGWSMGAVKNRVFHKANAKYLASPLRSHDNMSGGGTISFDASNNVKWTARFIIMSNGNGAYFATNGYFDITMPTSGTITGLGGAANKTATTSGIPLAPWEALYYILPLGQTNTTVNANFRVVSYTSALDVPEDWVLVAVHNGDETSVKFTAAPVHLRQGESYSTTTGQVWGFNIIPDATNTRNIGSASVKYANIYATTFNGMATSAQYADLAERYAADTAYEPGTVVVFGGMAEVTISSSANDIRVAGVISTNPAVMMNSEAGDDASHPYIALVGRAPCKVTGKISKGSMLTTSDIPGHATATANPQLGSIIGKALEDFDGDSGVIEIAVQRM